MNTIHSWTEKAVLALAVILKVTAGMAQEEATPTPVTSETLLETTTSWNGQALPKYPVGDPKINIMRYTIQPHTRMAVHRHDIISGGYMLEGELTIVSETGEEKTFRTGDALVETTGTWHYGENRGETPVVVVMLYIRADNIPLSERKKE